MELSREKMNFISWYDDIKEKEKKTDPYTQYSTAPLQGLPSGNAQKIDTQKAHNQLPEKLAVRYFLIVCEHLTCSPFCEV